MNSIYGLEIIIDNELMSELKEDWVNVRSPSRAARRRKRGFKQNIVTRKVAKKEFIRMYDKIIMHKEMYSELLKKMDENGRLFRSSDYASSNLSF